MFQRDLNQFLLDKKQDIDDLINDTDRYSFNQPDEKIILPEIIFVESKYEVDTRKIPISYHYELAKLVDRSDFTKFRFFSSLLKSKCRDNELVLAEIENMENNLDNTLEYYCSFHLVDRELNGFKNANR